MADSIGGMAISGTNQTGSFYTGDTSSNRLDFHNNVFPGTSAATTKTYGMKFSASRSSAYYGTTSKPQVDANQALMIIRT